MNNEENLAINVFKKQFKVKFHEQQLICENCKIFPLENSLYAWFNGLLVALNYPLAIYIHNYVYIYIYIYIYIFIDIDTLYS